MAFGKVTEDNVYTCVGEWLSCSHCWTIVFSSSVLLDDSSKVTHFALTSQTSQTGRLMKTSAQHTGIKPIDMIWTSSQNFDISSISSQVSKLKTLKGLSLQDILAEVHHYVHKLDLPAQVALFSKYWVLDRCFLGADPPSHQDGRAGGQADGRGYWKDSAWKLFGNVPGESADQIKYWNSFSASKPWVNLKQFSSRKCSQVTREMIKAEAEAQWKSNVMKDAFTLSICGAEPLNGLEGTWILPVIPVFFLPFILK